MEQRDARAERAILDRAEAYRLVEEARQMRDERDAAQKRISTLSEVVALLNSMVLSGESHSEKSRAMVREALG